MSDLIDRQAAIYSFEFDDDGTPWDMGDIIYRLEQMPSAQPDIVRCKDCKYFERNYWDDVGGHPLIVGHDICIKWADGCKTSEDGFCFLGERNGKKWTI